LRMVDALVEEQGVRERSEEHAEGRT